MENTTVTQSGLWFAYYGYILEDKNPIFQWWWWWLGGGGLGEEGFFIFVDQNINPCNSKRVFWQF